MRHVHSCSVKTMIIWAGTGEGGADRAQRALGRLCLDAAKTKQWWVSLSSISTHCLMLKPRSSVGGHLPERQKVTFKLAKGRHLYCPGSQRALEMASGQWSEKIPSEIYSWLFLHFTIQWIFLQWDSWGIYANICNSGLISEWINLNEN